MILSSKRYQKGNLTSHLRPSRFAALPPNAADILVGVTQLHISCGSLHRNRAKPRSQMSRPLMKHPAPHSSQCPDCAGALQRLPRNAGRGLIWLYRHTLSPLVGYNCRHLPTCSVYGDEAIERFGLWGGGWMTLARLLRCQPWGTSGIDNVPLTTPAGARWYLPWRYGRWRGVNGP
jgi:putative membrane protein insertion efficiency factor